MNNTSNEFVRPDESGKSNAWMITFADLLSLMLTFFILLFAMSEVRNKEWHELTTSLQDKLNPGRIIVRFEDEITQPNPVVQTKRGLNLSYAFSVLEDQLSERYGSNITIVQEDNRILVSLSSDASFKAGDASFSSLGLPMVKEVSNAVAKLPNKIEVYGYTDPRPINTKQYPSNWELSLARANNVARLIVAAGYESAIETLGMAESRYALQHQDLPDAQRMKHARRVDIVIKASEDF